MLRRITLFLLIMLSPILNATAAEKNWDQIVETAKGQEVYFNAWGGSADINEYINWVAQLVDEQYGITLKHVLIDDAAISVSRILTENENNAAKNSVDLIWINGENFKTLKENDALLHGVNPQLPNYALVNTTTLPTTRDFTIAVDDLEVPWGVAQLVFVFDSAVVSAPPTSASALLEYAKENPGRVTYPRPPQFHGSSFLKQVLIELSNNDSALQSPVEEADFDSISAPLWAYLDELHRVAWRKAQAFPTDASQMLQLLNDGELDIAFTFNPQEVATAINKGTLPKSAVSYALDIGALTNVHFVGIPKNSASTEAAMVVANVLISPEAQARKASTEYWGDPTVLNTQALTEDDRELFDSQYQLFKGLAEPHPSWQVALEEEWAKRYSR